MTATDLANVTGLLEVAERADGHRPLDDHLWLDLVEGGRAGFAGLVAWEPGHEHPVAYAQVTRGNNSWALELVVHPHHRYEMASIGPELLEAALGVIADEGGGHVHWWVFEPTSAHDELAARVGLTRGRTLFQMRRALPIDQTSDVTTRPFRVGQDEEAWLVVNNRAFHNHPEQGGWDLDTLAQREKEAWFDPDGFLLHERDGRLAAFCWTKVHAEDEPALGEIYVIAVDPDFHGLGLGRALTLAGLEHLAREGIPVGMLYVDADNDAALAPLPLARVRRPSDRPRLHGRRASMIPRSRYDVSRAELAELLDGEPRYRLDQVWHGLHVELSEPDEISSLPRALRERLATALPAGLELVTEQVERSRRHGEAPLAAGRRRGDRDRADALPRSSDGLRLHAGRVRDGMRLLCDRPGRLPAPPVGGRDRRAGGARRAAGPAGGAAAVQRRVHGDG